MNPMTAGLAGRMTVTVILAVIGYALLIVGIAKLMAYIGSFYSVPSEHDHMVSLEPYTESEFQQNARESEGAGEENVA